MMVQHKYLTPFHYVFLFVLFSKLCVSSLDLSYWWLYYEYGTRIPIFQNFMKIALAISEGGKQIQNLQRK